MKQKDTKNNLSEAKRLCLAANNLLRQGKENEALLLFSEASKIPGCYSAFKGLGDCYKLTENYNLAIENYEKFLSFDPKPPEAKTFCLKSLALCYEKTRQYEQAIEIYKKLIEANAEIDDFYSLALCYEKTSNYKLAEETYQRLIVAFPNKKNTKKFIKNYAVLKMNQKLYQEAFDILGIFDQELEHLDLCLLAVQCCSKGELRPIEQFKNFFRHLEKRFTSSKDTIKIQLALGRVYEGFKDYPNAKIIYEALYELYPNDKKIRESLKICCERLREHDKALKLLEQGNSISVLLKNSRTMRETNVPEEALKHLLEKAEPFFWENADFLLEVCFCLQALKRYSLMLDLLNKISISSLELKLMQACLALDVGNPLKALSVLFSIPNGRQEQAVIKTLLRVYSIMKAPLREDLLEVVELGENKEMRLAYACYLTEMGDIKKAQEKFTSLLTQYPEDREINLSYALLLEDQIKNEEALEIYGKLELKYPTDLKVLKAFAFFCEKIRLFELAIKKALLLLQIDPNRSEKLLSDIARNYTHLKNPNPNEIFDPEQKKILQACLPSLNFEEKNFLEHFSEQFSAKFPRNPKIRITTNRYVKYSNPKPKSYDQENYFENIAREYPLNFSNHLQLIDHYFEKEQPKKALRVLKNCLQQFPYHFPYWEKILRKLSPTERSFQTLFAWWTVLFPQDLFKEIKALNPSFDSKNLSLKKYSPALKQALDKNELLQAVFNKFKGAKLFLTGDSIFQLLSENKEKNFPLNFTFFTKGPNKIRTRLLELGYIEDKLSMWCFQHPQYTQVKITLTSYEGDNCFKAMYFEAISKNFTAQSIYLNSEGEIYDPCEGMSSIDTHILKSPGLSDLHMTLFMALEAIELSMWGWKWDKNLEMSMKYFKDKIEQLVLFPSDKLKLNKIVKKDLETFFDQQNYINKLKEYGILQLLSEDITYHLSNFSEDLSSSFRINF